jgi:hypothetical protein
LAAGAWNGVRSAVSWLQGEAVEGWRSVFGQRPSQEFRNDPLYGQVSTTSGSYSEFLANLMDDAAMQKYSAASTDPWIGAKCNVFYEHGIEQLEQYLAGADEKGKAPQLLTANEYAAFFRGNKNFFEISSDTYLPTSGPAELMNRLRMLTQNNVPVVGVYENASGPGHLFFVGTMDMRVRTTPATPYEGKTFMGLSVSEPTISLPVVQGGDTTGIATINYAMTGWREPWDKRSNESYVNPYRDGRLRFYGFKK